MDTVLMAVTLISLGIATALAVVVMRLLRDERRRSDARIAALTELAEEPESLAEGPAHTERPAPAPRREPAAAMSIRPEPAPAPVSAPVVAPAPRRLPDLEIRPATASATDPHGFTRNAPKAVADLFEAPEPSSPWGRRFAVIGVLILLGGTALFALLHQRTGRGESVASPTAIDAAASQAPAPLELVSLRHAQQGQTLTITGLVQNPKAGAPQTRLVVTAVVFGPDGTFLAGGRAPLDYTKLGAGDESPFVITVPVSGSVARYRVGFRAEDGNVVAHVDRRNDSDVRKAGL
jgi:hypothetical protein